MTLLVVGPLAICGADLLAERAVFPLVQAAVWPPVEAAMGWGDKEWMEIYTYPLSDSLATTSATAFVMVVVGGLVGRAMWVAPLDGLWIANPVSMIGGHVLWYRLSDTGYLVEHWGLTMWVLQLLVASQIYAWLFSWGARFSGVRPAA